MTKTDGGTRPAAVERQPLILGGKKMGTRVKPVQPTEIRDKKIALEAIEQIRKPIPASVYKRQGTCQMY